MTLSKRGRTVRNAIYCVLVYLFLFLPIAVVVAGSFNATESRPYLTWKGFSLMWYQRLFDGSQAALMEAFGHTMLIALTSTLLSTVIGTLVAVGMYRYRFRGKALIDALLYVPVVIPEIVMGISLLVLFAQAQVPRGMLTLVIAHTTFCIPFVVFNVRARLAGYDVSVEEASLDLGANRVQTFWNITVPVLAPGIGAGALLAFTLSIDDVIISYFVNGKTSVFPLKVMESIKMGVPPSVNALSAILLLFTVIFVVLTQSDLLSRHRSE